MDKDAFKEYVEGANKLCTKWQYALILSNLFWAIVLGMFIWFAYLTPVEMSQEQNNPEQVQTQITKGVR